MHTVVLESPESLRLVTRPEPTVGGEDVVVRIRATGICGTDVSIFSGKVAVDYPLVLGHEMVGILESSTPELAHGTRVVVDPNVFCGTCYQCLRGQENVCGRAELMGRDRDGALTDLLAVPARNVYPIPEELDDRIAPLLQVLTTCLHAQRQTQLFPQDSVVVLGLGVSGLLHLQLARARGAHPIIGITRSESKRSLAVRLGADLVIDPSEPALKEQVVEATQGQGPDLVVECVGKTETLAQAIDLVRVGGRIVVFGTITEVAGELPFYQLYYKELSLANPRAAKPEDFPASIGLVTAGTVELDPLVTHTFPLESAEEAIATSSESSSLKVILDHGSVAQ
ncbi:MAG: alcohol dehydrogenase catalytic domain-containing protein [Actinomycetota bacterium]|nr:alcohol dehydrogenase catalytic domain-containing protein [Actinomycetota bacterium]